MEQFAEQTCVERSDEDRRLKETVESIPSEVSTVLEIGFSDLRMTRLLSERFDLVSVDLPGREFHAGKFRLAFADIARLPFKTRSFHAVICTEVLEHLPLDVLQRGIEEINRVADKYIVISVPYKQRVWNEHFKCIKCGHEANTMAHLHHFDEDSVLRRFPAWRAKRVHFLGETNGYAPDVLYRIAGRMGNAWHPYDWNCPGCGQNPGTQTPNWFGWALQRIIWRIEGRTKRRPAWILMVLARAGDQ